LLSPFKSKGDANYHKKEGVVQLKRMLGSVFAQHAALNNCLPEFAGHYCGRLKGPENNNMPANSNQLLNSF